MKTEYSLTEYIPAAARKGKQVSGHRPGLSGLSLFGMPCGSSARIAMTGGGDNDTSSQSQAEREKTVTANEGSSARTADGVKEGKSGAGFDFSYEYSYISGDSLMHELELYFTE